MSQYGLFRAAPAVPAGAAIIGAALIYIYIYIYTHTYNYK